MEHPASFLGCFWSFQTLFLLLIVLLWLLSLKDSPFVKISEWKIGGYSPLLRALPPIPGSATASPEGGDWKGKEGGQLEGGVSLSISSLNLPPFAATANKSMPLPPPIRSFYFLCLEKSPRRSPSVSSIMAS